MNIGLCGVSCTGKTTLFNGLKNHFGDKLNYIEEIKKHEVLEQCKFVEEDLQTIACSLTFNKELIHFLQEIELGVQRASNKDCLIDHCTVNNLMYYIFYGSAFEETKISKMIMENVIGHINRYYNILLYIPFNRRNVPASHRRENDEYTLDMQDAIIARILFRYIRVQVIKTWQYDEELGKQETLEFVINQLQKRGLKV